MDKRISDEIALFADKVRLLIPIKMIVLYGSYAKGTERQNSDIDIAVIVEELNGNWLTVSGKLFLLSAEIDANIEPNLIIAKNNKSGFLESILEYGQIIYDSGKAA